MNKQNLVAEINKKLNGEMLSFTDLLVHLDKVVGDINDRLHSCFPSFTEAEALPGYTGDYNFFPEHYITTVVIIGAAYRFYETEEEGENVAVTYYGDFQTGLYMMQRDYGSIVPLIFQRTTGGVYNMGPAAQGVSAISGYFGSSIPASVLTIPGPRGSRGYSGPQGISGDKGDKGEPGVMGPAGSQGAQGIYGVVGPQGPIGPIGPQGLRGFTGVVGPKGNSGDRGFDGFMGPVGPQGPQGIQGIQGPIGNTGADSLVPGPQGPQGIQGIQGPIGNTGADSLVPGPVGPAGLNGMGAVDSVNAKVGAIVLNPDDLDDATSLHKFVAVGDITKLSNLSGTNAGDETVDTIKTKLGITLLSGSNTGDQTLAGLGGEPIITVKNTAFNKNYGTVATDVKINGPQAVGGVDAVARIDHVHPTDTTRQAALIFGIADTNKVQISAADVASGEYARFNATGLESRTAAEVLSGIGAEPVISSKNTAFNKNYGTVATDVKINGPQAVGVADAIARIDHVHPVDTSRQVAGTYSTDYHANIVALNAVNGTNTGDQTLASLGAATFKKSTGTFALGGTTCVVTDAFVTVDTMIIVSPTAVKVGSWSVVSSAGSFTITSDAIETANVTFDWGGTK